MIQYIENRCRKLFTFFRLKIWRIYKIIQGKYPQNIDSLQQSYGSASRDDIYFKQLWVKSASLFIPQLYELVSTYSEFNVNIKKIEEFDDGSSKSLAAILNKYGSDKSRLHNYDLLYNYIFKSLGINSNIDLLEIGLGTNNTKLISNMGKTGKPGASIRAFKEFLPNANVYGADIDKHILFEEERIKTTYVDQLDLKTFKELQQHFNVEKFDVIIDDGLHAIGANLNTLLFALDAIKDDGWIVIEDIEEHQFRSPLKTWEIIDSILSKNNGLETFIVKTSISHYLYVVHKLSATT